MCLKYCKISRVRIGIAHNANVTPTQGLIHKSNKDSLGMTSYVCVGHSHYVRNAVSSTRSFKYIHAHHQRCTLLNVCNDAHYCLPALSRWSVSPTCPLKHVNIYTPSQFPHCQHARPLSLEQTRPLKHNIAYPPSHSLSPTRPQILPRNSGLSSTLSPTFMCIVEEMSVWVGWVGGRVYYKCEFSYVCVYIYIYM